MHVSLCGAAVSGNVDLSNMGMDCYNHRVITPTCQPNPPYTVYNMTVSPPSIQLVQLFSPHLQYYVFVGGHSLSLCLSGNL